MKLKNIAIVAVVLLAACTKENKDVVKPTAPKDLPLQIILDEDEAAEIEDEDKTEMVFTFTDRYKGSENEPGGFTPTLTQGVRVNCKIVDPEGFSTLTDYITGISAYYEIDDCTNQDVDVQVNLSTGEFSVEFPAEVEELIVEFELNDGLFDDNTLNGDDRGFKVQVVGLSATHEPVVINTNVEFEHVVLDDEKIFGEYELELNQSNFDNFKKLFGDLDEDIAAVLFNKIDAIELEISTEDFEVKIITTDTEQVTECGTIETVNIEFEVEGELEELTDDDVQGELEFIVELEDDKGFVEEITFKGEFTISGDSLSLTLESEDLETGEITIELSR